MSLDAITDPLAAAQAVVPRIRAAGDAIEAGRRLPPDLVEEMRAAGMFHLAVPRAYGGVEADPVTASRVVEEASAADGSAGWCVMLAAQAGIYGGFITPEVGRSLFQGGGIMAGVARPIGRAVPASDGSGYTVRRSAGAARCAGQSARPRMRRRALAPSPRSARPSSPAADSLPRAERAS